MHDY
ncbi:hypothetical protein PENPOL_c002G09882 [Penicillium polonicum]|jgi:1-phosphatidylinositol-4-phosphate 5-kinase